MCQRTSISSRCRRVAASWYSFPSVNRGAAAASRFARSRSARMSPTNNPMIHPKTAVAKAASGATNNMTNQPARAHVPQYTWPGGSGGAKNNAKLIPQSNTPPPPTRNPIRGSQKAMIHRRLRRGGVVSPVGNASACMSSGPMPRHYCQRSSLVCQLAFIGLVV